jgi:cysteine desulfurase
MIYLDNNATTVMPLEVKKEMIKWCNVGNPSADYESAVVARKRMEDLRNLIGKLCGIRVCCKDIRDGKQAIDGSFRILFTSGASEANATVVHNIITNFPRPHIAYSAVEHKSIIDAIVHYQALGLCTSTVIPVTVSGHCPPTAVAGAMQANTKLVCVMHANNETGAVNDIHAIGQIAHRAGALFHTDAVQTFGKYYVRPLGNDGLPLVDSFCVSFHKMGGPPGVGILAIRQGMLQTPLIFGSQNGGLRGGTENMPGIGASYKALSITADDRTAKNLKQRDLKTILCKKLSLKFPVITYHQYTTMAQKPAVLTIVLISGIKNYLPGTLLISIVGRPGICNAKIKKRLAEMNIIVSVGSACNTASAKASHVLYAMMADEAVRAGALRISLGDSNTERDINALAEALTGILANVSSVTK